MGRVRSYGGVADDHRAPQNYSFSSSDIEDAFVCAPSLLMCSPFPGINFTAKVVTGRPEVTQQSVIQGMEWLFMPTLQVIRPIQAN